MMIFVLIYTSVYEHQENIDKKIMYIYADKHVSIWNISMMISVVPAEAWNLKNVERQGDKQKTRRDIWFDFLESSIQVQAINSSP
jgi:hypothetical protein